MTIERQTLDSGYDLNIPININPFQLIKFDFQASSKTICFILTTSNIHRWLKCFLFHASMGLVKYTV